MKHASGTGEGENLAWASWALTPTQAVNMWGDEKSFYTSYVPIDSSNYQTFGHYTQMVWRDTTQIGCAVVTCASGSIVVCRYSPPGNYLGEYPY